MQILEAHTACMSIKTPACVSVSSSLPVKQVLSASRAANTAAWPSSGAHIPADRGHGDLPREEQEEEEEGAAAEESRC